MPKEILAKTILNKTKRRDPWFLDEYTANPWSGCPMNCLYCYIRGSKYGENLAESLSVKTNAVELFQKELARRAAKGQHGIIVLSSATDPYPHFEEEQKTTRRFLEIILEHRFPLHVITKSDLVVRDLDLLQEIGRMAILPKDLEGQLEHRVFISFSFSTFDAAVAKIFEPGAPEPKRRLQAMKVLSDAGLLSGASLMPLLPFISDTQEALERGVNELHSHGARYAFPATLTLFGNGPADSRTLVLRSVAKHFPELLDSYQKLFGESPANLHAHQKELEKRVRPLMEKFGIPDRLF